MAEKLIDILTDPVASALEQLLCDQSTKKNIIWATDTYAELGAGFQDADPMDARLLRLHADLICPRIEKSLAAQAQRTRKKAEVFTPAWLCNRMNNYLDEDWFGCAGAFNVENDDHTWTVSQGKVAFPAEKRWQEYVDSRRLEITCGEAPYLVSRYDVTTGERIEPARRIGLLDRKLRIVNEHTRSYEGWLTWALRALESCYGYEYQGDNVLIARINLLLTFLEYHAERWQRPPEEETLNRLINIITWNLWQMDGLKDAVPLGKPEDDPDREIWFKVSGMVDSEPPAVLCSIFDWRSRQAIKFRSLKEL